MNRRIPLAPSEGWLTLGVVIVMGLSLAWAIDDARWVLGRAEYLDMLVFTAIGGVLAGFIGPKVGWGRWLTYLIGAIFAALIVPLLVGLVELPAGASIHDLYHVTATSVVQAYIDLAILNLSATSQYLHYIFVLGMLVWATMMFASYAVFGHHRPLNAVIVVGVILVGNMAFTYQDELQYLVLFSIAALFLLIRSHVYEEQAEWLRRRIGDPTSISSVYLRGGSVFIAVAVISSFFLTQTAASAPLAGAWNGVEDGLLSLSRSVSRFLPTGGSTRPVGLSFGDSMQVEQQWKFDPGVALTIQRDPSDKTEYYWRAVTYDRIDLTVSSLTKAAQFDVGADQPILDGLAEDPNPEGLHSFTFTVTPGKFRLPTMVSPATPVSAGEEVRLTTAGASGYFGTLDRAKGAGAYTITALVAVPGNDAGQLNESALEATETTYPDDIKAIYLAPLPDGMLGPDALKLEVKILAQAKSDAPYDVAKAAERELQSSDFTYSTDVRHLECQGISTAECFARFKQGFCQYYATTMAAILRHVGIPARIVEGFLPGDLDPRTGIETIEYSKAHAWVEVYFPGYDWVRFDPTSPSVSRAQVLPSGPPVASAAPRASSSAGPLASRDPKGERDPGFYGSAVLTGRGNLGPLLVVGLLLLLVVLVVAFLAWRRGPRGPVSADGAYGSVTRLAARFGFGPRPAQTVYEYATVLGDVLPDVRPELQTVARAKVESTYAREILGDARISALRAAQRRLRVSLLRLAFRRKERRRRR
jgi:transglutaminase-like putative cysteine protease